MPEQVTTVQGLVGRTISLATREEDVWDGPLLILFTDGDYAIFAGENEGMSASLCIDNKPSDAAELALGLITVPELEARRQGRDREWRQQQEERERKQLAELQAKYAK